MTATARTRDRNHLIDVFCDEPSLVQNAMQGNGQYPVKLNTGAMIVLILEGDYLTARVTPENAKVLASMSLFEVQDMPRAVDPEAPVRNFMEQGVQLHHEKSNGKKQEGSSDGILQLLAALGLGGGALSDQVTHVLAAKMEAEATRRAEERLAAEAARRVADSAEFGFVRLSEELTDDQVISLINSHMPDRDPATIPSAARVTLLSKAAPTNYPLQAALRDLLPEFE